MLEVANCRCGLALAGPLFDVSLPPLPTFYGLDTRHHHGLWRQSLSCAVPIHEEPPVAHGMLATASHNWIYLSPPRV